VPLVAHARIALTGIFLGERASRAGSSRASASHRGTAHQRRSVIEQPLGLAASAASRELPIAISTLRTAVAGRCA